MDAENCGSRLDTRLRYKTVTERELTRRHPASGKADSDKCTQNSRTDSNVCYSSGHNLVSSFLLSKHDIRNMTLPTVLYLCDIWSL
jgi:hypothetical protein